MTPRDPHPCPGPGCPGQVPWHQLMCPRHWRMVPAPLQSAVWRTWAGGVGYGTPEHVQAMDAAIRSLEKP